jgi:hypothetical protein
MMTRASRLHSRELILGQTRIATATLFPFFDCNGLVEQVMIVDADSSDLLSFRVDEMRVRVPLWGPIRMDGSVVRLDEYMIDHFAPLWHFDPWCLLQDKRFADQAIIPVLTATNCAEAFLDQRPSDLLFNQRLSQLRKVQFPAPAESYQHRPFGAEMLPSREAASLDVAEKSPTGWQLIPIW